MNLSVMKNKNYVLVLMGRLVSDFGTYLQSFALSLYVLEKTGSPALFSTVIAVSIIPRILLMPFAGVLSDKISRKKMVVLMDVLSGIFVLAIAALFIAMGELTLPIIYAIVIVLNTISVFFSPSMSSMIPDIVKKDNLADANSMMELVSAVITVAAPITAGFLYGAFGIFVILLADGISFLISAFSESFIKIEKESLIPADNKESFITNFKEGIAYLKTVPEFFIVIGVAIIANFALAPIFSIALPVVIIKDFGLSEAVYGVVTSLMSIGMFVGPVLASGIIKKYHYSKLVSTILTISGVICMLIAISSIKSLLPNVYINTVIMVVLINILMIIILWTNLALATARQKIVPGHLMGRVFSVVGMFAIIAMPIGQILMGALLDKAETYWIIGAFAVLVMLSGILAKIGFAYLRKRGKMYTEPEAIDEPAIEPIAEEAAI